MTETKGSPGSRRIAGWLLAFPHLLKLAFLLSPLALLAWAWLVGGGVGSENGWLVARLVGPPPCDRPLADGCDAVKQGTSDLADCSREHADVCLVPVGGIEPEVVAAMRDRFESELGLRVVVLPGVPLSQEMLDSERGQFSSSGVVNALWNRYPESRSQTVLTLGITPGDVYIPEIARWRFAFGAVYPNDGLGGTAVISTNRMQAAEWRVWPSRLSLVVRYGYDEEPLATRATKMVRKYIGYVTYRLPMSSDPHSAMFGGILGVGDLDAMAESLPAPRTTSAP